MCHETARLPKPEEICRRAKRLVILENVVNPTNVGAIFRFCCGLVYGWDSSDSRLQQSIIPQSCQSQYGDGISGSLDLSG